MADNSERIIDLPNHNAMALADTPGGHSYGSSRIVKYVHSSCKEFKSLQKRLEGKK